MFEVRTKHTRKRLNMQVGQSYKIDDVTFTLRELQTGFNQNTLLLSLDNGSCYEVHLIYKADLYDEENEIFEYSTLREALKAFDNKKEIR